MKNLLLTMLLSVISVTLFADEGLIGGDAGTRFPVASKLIREYRENPEETKEKVASLIEYLRNYTPAEARAALGPDALAQAKNVRDALSQAAQNLLNKIREAYPANANMMPGAGRTPNEIYSFIVEELERPMPYATGLLPRTGVA